MYEKFVENPKFRLEDLETAECPLPGKDYELVPIKVGPDHSYRLVKILFFHFNFIFWK
jgi:hypothetical protein